MTDSILQGLLVVGSAVAKMIRELAKDPSHGLLKDLLKNLEVEIERIQKAYSAASKSEQAALDEAVSKKKVSKKSAKKDPDDVH